MKTGWRVYVGSRCVAQFNATRQDALAFATYAEDSYKGQLVRLCQHKTTWGMKQ